MAKSKTPSGAWYVVYQDLNEPQYIFIARLDEVVSGTFRRVAGPFETLSEAERALEKAKRIDR